MKIFIIFIVATGFLVGNCQADQNSGRFQLVNGEVEILKQEPDSVMLRPIDKHLVLKIDTSTGKTWRYMQVLGKDSFTEGWVEIGNMKGD